MLFNFFLLYIYPCGDDSVAQLVALMSGVVLGGVAEVVGSNLVSRYFFFFLWGGGGGGC